MNEDLKIVERYISEGRRTIPVPLVKPLIEMIRKYHERNSDYLDAIVTIITDFYKKYEKEIKKQNEEG